MRSKLAGIVGIVALGLAVVLGATADLGPDSVNDRTVQADTHGPGSPAPVAPGA
ncbi:hypothetical protein [Streptomyces sp. NPDC086023]|uniref:hypothetical protein n=1 Tax=Streptomyces sp. NPDC086023 TaxID=3365746 RepID=UPI0037CD8060